MYYLLLYDDLDLGNERKSYSGSMMIQWLRRLRLIIEKFIETLIYLSNPVAIRIGIGMNAIEARDLTKQFGDFTAVNCMSFEVKEGEIFGFLGPNGSGKSTTIRMLTGLIKPEKGTALIMGYDIGKKPLEAKQIMGIVPEMSNAYVELSAWNNIMLMGELYGVSRRERIEKAEKLLGQFGLYERKDSSVRSFSKGIKQRLILCMALIHDPKVLFLDEPTSGLDVESSRLIKNIIRDLNKAGTTVFLTTHNMEEANQLCDRIAIINHGEIAAIDRTEMLKLGSRGLRSIEVSFNGPVNVEELSKISCIKQIKEVGDKVKFYIDDPDEAIGCITEYARLHGIEIITLNTLSPSLEDIFVELTGKDKGICGHRRCGLKKRGPNKGMCNGSFDHIA